MSNFTKELKIYKPNRNFTGCAIQFGLNQEKEAIFVTFAQQVNKKDDNGNFLFDWDNKSIFKLDMNDMGQILSVLHNRQNGVGPIKNEKHSGLFHKNQNGNSVMYFTKGRNAGFFIALSVVRGENKKQYKCTLTNGEGEVLSTLLQRAIICCLDW